MNDAEPCCLLGWATGFNAPSTFDSAEFDERHGIQSQAVAAVVTMDTDIFGSSVNLDPRALLLTEGEKSSGEP